MADHLLLQEVDEGLGFIPRRGYPVTVTKLSTFRVGTESLRTALNRPSADYVVDLQGGSFSDSDFSVAGFYTYYTNHCIGIVNGAMTITTGSSTHATAVNAQVAANSGTVGETILRVGRGSSQATTGYISDLVMDGTGSQGHIFNGLNVYWQTNGTIKNFTVLGVPGSSGAPPGETFPIDNYNSDRSNFINCMVDGNIAGSPTAASGMGNNSCDQILAVNSTFKNMGHGHGSAHYQSSNPCYINCTFQNNHSAGLNFEKTTGVITVVGCTFIGNSECLIVDTDGASARVNIYDPIWSTAYGTTGTPASFDIRRHNTYNYPPPATDPNQQLVSDFHIYMGGTWVGGRPEDGGHYVGGSEVTSTYLKVTT